jgi:hypothetical protein
VQIELAEVEFNAKISSVTMQESTTDTKIGVELSASGGFGAYSASLTASFSHQQTSKNSNTEQREYSMRVYVRAVQDDMPAGMKKILDVLEQAILITLKGDS